MSSMFLLVSHDIAEDRSILIYYTDIMRGKSLVFNKYLFSS
jgi:hypothetical protein